MKEEVVVQENHQERFAARISARPSTPRGAADHSQPKANKSQSTSPWIPYTKLGEVEGVEVRREGDFSRRQPPEREVRYLAP